MSNIQLTHTAHKPSGITHPLCFLAHDIDVPMNIGSLFRIADALGVERIYLTGQSVTPPNHKITKTSRSTEKYVPFEYAEDPLVVVDHLKLLGYRIVSLEITSQSIDIKRFTPLQGQKHCLILGAENMGVPQQLLDASDIAIHIPMLGQNSSMNVANACSIAAYEMIRKLEND